MGSYGHAFFSFSALYSVIFQDLDDLIFLSIFTCVYFISAGLFMIYLLNDGPPEGPGKLLGLCEWAPIR